MRLCSVPDILILLTGYMNLADALSVSASLHTTEGLFWPVPVINLTKDISGYQRR